MILLRVIYNFIISTFIDMLTSRFITCYLRLVYVKQVGFAFSTLNSVNSSF